MKEKIPFLCSVITLMLMSNCASIVSKSTYPISINSSPSGATISVTDSKGVEVYKGNTPATVKLKAGNGFFKKASYQVNFSKEGYDEKTVPIKFKVDGWYWGNIVFGGLIGMLIIDPATGAMYKLKTEFLHEILTQSPVSLEKTELRIYGMNEIPSSWKDHLVLLSE